LLAGLLLRDDGFASMREVVWVLLKVIVGLATNDDSCGVEYRVMESQSQAKSSEMSLNWR